MDSKEVRGLMEAYAQVHIPQEVSEAYQEPRFARKDYLNKLSNRGGMGMGTPTDPHGYRDPKMAKVGSEFSKRKTAAAKAKKTGTPDSYRAEKESQSKLRKEEVDIFDVVLEFLCVEGYAETLEEAEWMMANELTPEDIEEILEARRADIEGHARGTAANPTRAQTDVPYSDPSQRTNLHSKLKRRADEMGRERRSSSRYRQGGRPPLSKKEKAFLQASDRTSPGRGHVRSPNRGDTGSHAEWPSERRAQRDPKQNPKHNANR